MSHLSHFSRLRRAFRAAAPFLMVHLGLLACGGGGSHPEEDVYFGNVQAPVLKWAYGGCDDYCDRGWYAGPAVADVDGDGRPEVLWGGDDLFSLSGLDGSVEWSADGGGRIWPAVAVADLDGDGGLEIVVGRGGASDQVTVYRGDGSVFPGWPVTPHDEEVRSLAVEDLDQDGDLEVIVGRAEGGDTGPGPLSVYEHNGALRPGWPAPANGEPGMTRGMYNQNLAVGDLDGDGAKEIYAPTDVHYITALDGMGGQLTANSIFDIAGPRFWSEVGVHVEPEVDFLSAGSLCDGGSDSYRPNFANVAPVIADLDQDGSAELVVPGDVYDCRYGDPAGDLFYLPFVFRFDRTRWVASGFDWNHPPQPPPNSGPLAQEDYDFIEDSVSNAVVADLDGDGTMEILYAAYDGRMHAWWLDKTQHHRWPYDIPGSGVRFAAEPAVTDLDNDGFAEVIFTSYPQKTGGGDRLGRLHVLNYRGQALFEIDLPAPRSRSWNGGLGAPTVADIDGDADLELVVGTADSGVVAYDLPGSAGGGILWGTSRGNMKRTGTLQR